jgi:hypothetical protein
MGYTYLPGIFREIQDGNVTIIPVNTNPVVMVVGTADQGETETVHRVNRIADSARLFGKEGTLARGMYESAIAGAQNINLFRIGGTPALLETVGTGLTIETVLKDDSAGTDYKLFWDDSELRLFVYRTADDELVYDNYPAYPDDRVDLGEVVVTGTATAGPGDIGAAGVDNAITLAAADGVSGASYTAGTDGLQLSRMEMYQALFDAYQLLEDVEIDVVLPMNVYLDDLNVMDMNAATVTTLDLVNLTNFPTAGADDDVLGKLYTEEYEGVNYFWWWFMDQPAASSPTFTAAQVFTAAGVGSATASTKIDGTALSAADFHEVNFAHQLANFCYVQGRDTMEMTGNVGVLPPTAFSLKGMALWVGVLPTFEADTATGKQVVAAGGNGTGLLGNKFMAGRVSSGGATGTPGYTVDGLDGLAHGGFIATDTGWLDDTELKDDNDHLIDIGKYINVVATYPVLSNASRATAYTASGAATYGGFYSVLGSASAPTNKILGNMRLPARINSTKLDLLAGQRYVTFHQKPRGIVVSDAPTAARPDSDYQRLSTVRQVKTTIDRLRAVGEPFLGEGQSGAQTAALDTAIDQELGQIVKDKILSRYEYQLIITPAQRVLGQATVELKLVPSWELRQITLVVALAAV